MSNTDQLLRRNPKPRISACTHTCVHARPDAHTGKWVNVGQTCIAPDYILCHSAVKPQLMDAMKKFIPENFGADIKTDGVTLCCYCQPHPPPASQPTAHLPAAYCPPPACLPAGRPAGHPTAHRLPVPCLPSMRQCTHAATYTAACTRAPAATRPLPTSTDILDIVSLEILAITAYDILVTASAL